MKTVRDVVDGHLPSPVWSPTIQNMVTYLPKDGHPFFKGWSPTISRMVKHYSQGGNPPLKGMAAHHPQDDHPPTVEWSPTIPEMVIPFPRMVDHHFQDDQIDWGVDSSTAHLV